MAVVDAWISAHLDPHLGRGSLLVLASTRVLAARIRRFLAERGGAFDVEVATPRGLVRQLATRPGRPIAATPALAEQFADRPGLFAHARSLLEAAAAAGLAGADLAALPLAWRQAAAAGGGTPFEHGLARLLATRRTRTGFTFAGGVSFQRVVAVGFVGQAAPWIARLLDHFGATPAVAPEATNRLPWVAARDPSSEARLTAAALLGGYADDGLVLVQDRATALRVRDALTRNGIACGWSDAGTLRAHPLAAAARQAARWLSSGDDPMLRGGEIERWIGLAGLGRNLGDDEDACAKSGGAGWFARRPLLEAIELARLLEAPCSRWVSRLRALPASVDEGPWTRATGIRLAFVLARLGAPTGEVSGTVGAVRRLVLDLGVRFHDDALARSILGGMREMADVPCDAVAMDDLLSRPVDARELRPGVEILTYDEYDGRPSASLILLDLHDRGIARRTVPDPLLDDASLDAIGLRTGRSAIAERLAQLRRACAAAKTTLAVVAARDATGRPVVAPTGLALAAAPVHVEIGLPEDAAWDVLERRDGPPAGDDAPDLAAHLARQATLEWIRAGRAPDVPALAPWSGDAGDAGRLDLSHTWSVSRLFRPLAHCPWQAFARVILGVTPRDAVAEELDPAEVGTAVHLALERAGPALRWRAGGEDTRPARAEAVDILARETARAFSEQGEALGGLSPARTAAVTGGSARWIGHWKTWVESRIREPGGVPSTLAEESLAAQPAFGAAIQRLDALLEPSISAGRSQREHAVRRLARMKARGDRPDPASALGTLTDHALPEDALGALRLLWADPALDRLAAVSSDLERRAAVLLDRVTAVVTEVGLEGIEVALGEVRVTVTGKVDRVDRVGDWLRVVDYKTGGMPQPRLLVEQLASGVEPQLLIYALALRAASWPPDHPLAGTDVAAAGWDYLRDTLEYERREPKRAIKTDQLLVGEDFLETAARALGLRVGAAAEGRWPLAPNARTCPALATFGHDHCAYAGACRLRGVQAAVP